MPAYWLTPDWPAPSWVQAVCTTRAGGVSQGPFASMNLGEHVGDEPLHVQANRAGLAQALSVRPVYLQQVHGVDVVHLSEDSPDGMTADASLCQRPQLACTVMVADCLPILLAHDRLPLVAALHAGWRGLAGQARAGQAASGIVESTVAALARAAGCSVAELAPRLLAWLGPCIGPSAFEVGAEVRAAFGAGRSDALAHFSPASAGKYFADLPALARQRLARLGVQRCYGNDGSAAWCTVTDSVFFSHRRSWSTDGVTGGRMAACIWLR
jgi:YfiH family protein